MAYHTPLPRKLRTPQGFPVVPSWSDPNPVDSLCPFPVFDTRIS